MTRIPDPARADDGAGVVYVMTNAADQNAIIAYQRAPDGRLTQRGSYATGSRGSGVGVTLPPDPLGSQDALLLWGHWLFAVNAGSNEVSVFRAERDRLTLRDTVASGGRYSVSLTFRPPWLYVLNAGGVGTISEFTLDQDGHLTPLADAVRALGTPTPDDGAQPHILESPAQVGFSPQGDQLVVSDKGALSGQGRLLVFAVAADGTPADRPVTTITAGNVPFSFTFDRGGHLLVTDPSANTVTSYALAADGSLRPRTVVASQQQATCWIVCTPDGRYAYTDNTTSHTTTGYRLGADGSLSLLDADGVTASAGAGALPIDLALSDDGRFLYTLNTGHGAVGMYAITAEGRLSAFGEVAGLPVLQGVQGIAAR